MFICLPTIEGIRVVNTEKIVEYYTYKTGIRLEMEEGKTIDVGISRDTLDTKLEEAGLYIPR